MPNRTIQKLFLAYKPALDKTPQPLKYRKAIQALSQCRTRDMGVSYYSCPEGHEDWEQFHSCRHRSCYLCAQKKRVEWVEQQQQRLLNTPHFHVIFTLPHEYLSLWRYNETLFTRILFKASQQSLMELMADAKYGGVTPGLLMTLHTWGRQLNLHPHTHCLVTAGGLTKANGWQDSGTFLLPSAVLRRYYRGKIQAFLKEAMEAGDLVLPPDMSKADFWQQYRGLYRKEWSVRIEERYAHGKGVMLYLARYCKGGPLNPEQIKGWSQGQIEMSYLDHRSKRIRRQQLRPLQLIQRLLQHVPTDGIHTVRYYGLYAPAAKQKYEQALSWHGNLAGLSVRRGLDVRTMLLCCKTCGTPAQLQGRVWRHAPKGNSFINSRPELGASGTVQPGDAPYTASVLHSDLAALPP
ncbi:IS91 family transposase [Nitrincola alkalilacustris]|uniref:IS91 family transposase n=1 Tax=Nitrincola alkalilacustris TaxID=1571224 RepID=UPI0014564A6E|nr:transposase [Nitrincola alkalilacustris]